LFRLFISRHREVCFIEHLSGYVYQGYLTKINMTISETHLTAENTQTRIVLSAGNNHNLWIKHRTVHFFIALNPFLSGQIFPVLMQFPWNIISFSGLWLLELNRCPLKKLFQKKERNPNTVRGIELISVIFQC